MKVLPLWQPWATLVAIGAKRIETRSWCAPDELVGQRIAIHATKGGLPKRDEERICDGPGFYEALAYAGYGRARRDRLPRGAIVATVVLARCRRINATEARQLVRRNPREFAFGDYTPGRWAWVLEDVDQLDEPVPFKARQGISEIPDEQLGRKPPIAVQGTLL